MSDDALVTEAGAPLRLDATREEALGRAARLIERAWRSFDSSRPDQPGLDEHVQTLLRSDLPDEPSAALDVVEDAARVLDQSIAQTRPRYFGFIGSSALEIATIGDLLASCFDVNLAIDAAAATRIEQQAGRWAAEFVGYGADCATAFTSGGTVSNMSALMAARERALPGCRLDGLAGRQAAVYCSGDVHYSITRAVEMLGIGSRSVRLLPLDDRRRMVPDALEEAIDADLGRGVVPVAVVATAGTTLTGAVDPIGDIAEICARKGVWLHVDGAYGLPAAATASRAHLFGGLDRADSVSLDAHKWLYMPKPCSVSMVRSTSDLLAAFAHDQAYLPHETREVHAVDTTLEYSRPFRALKLWMAFRAHGAAAFRESLERDIRHAELCYEQAQSHPDLEVLQPPELSIVPFRHVPRGIDDLNRHNRELARALQRDGRIYVASAEIGGKVYLRPCFVNFRTGEDDVLALIEIAREVGNRLAG